MNVFISYNHNDQLPALRIQRMIEKELNDKQPLITVWMDSTDLSFGKGIDTEVEKALIQTDLVLLIWSKNAADSRGVQHEIEIAMENNIRIVPCLLDNTHLPEGMGRFGMLGIDFSQYSVGELKLKGILLNNLNPGFFATDDDRRQHTQLLNLMSRFNNKVERGSLKTDEKIFMIKEVVLPHLFDTSSAKENERIDSDYKNFINDLLLRMEKAESISALEGLMVEFKTSRYYEVENNVNLLVERIVLDVEKEENGAVGSATESSREEQLLNIYKHLRTWLSDYAETKEFTQFVSSHFARLDPGTLLPPERAAELAEELMIYVAFTPVDLYNSLQQCDPATAPAAVKKLREMADDFIAQYQSSGDKKLLEFLRPAYEAKFLIYSLYNKGYFLKKDDTLLQNEGRLGEILTWIYNEDFDTKISSSCSEITSLV